MNLKELSKLVSLCRKNGISHYKSESLEFTLDLNYQPRVVKRAKKQINKSADEILSQSLTLESTDEEAFVDLNVPNLTEEQLIAWSTGESEA